MSDVSTLLVVAPNWLGDAVMALPALMDVRRAYPRARLVVAARAPVAPLYEMVSGIDSVMPLQWRGALRDRAALGDDVARIQVQRPDVAILLPNSFAAAWLLRRANVAERWGYATDLRRLMLTRAVARPRGSVHQAVYYQQLVAQLGIPIGSLDVHVAADEHTLDDLRSKMTERGWNQTRPLVVIAPGAAYGTAKRWLPEHFATLMDRIGSDLDAQMVIVGSVTDAATTRLVLERVAPETLPKVIDLTGQTSLEALAAVMSMAAVCVSNDSGAMHIAAATGAPLVALFGPTRDRETSPLTRAGRAQVLVNQVWCRPCMLRECPIDHRCMKGLLPDTVFHSLRDLMRQAS